MIVKSNEKNISFLFQEKDPYYEMGFKILEHANISSMLKYKRKNLNGCEKIVFDVTAKNLAPLSDVINDMNDYDLIDLLYELIYLINEVERTGLLGKECIWYNFENIYYDIEKRIPMVAIIPLAGELRKVEGRSWKEWFNDAMIRIASFLSEKKRDRFVIFIGMYGRNTLDYEGLLEEVNLLGSGKSGMLVNTPIELPTYKMQLLYVGREGRIEFLVEEDDFILGKSPEKSDGVLDISEAVSRRHCLFTKINNSYFVQDLDSANHTFVNGIIIPAFQLMELEQSDIVSIADIDFRVNFLNINEQEAGH